MDDLKDNRKKKKADFFVRCPYLSGSKRKCNLMEKAGMHKRAQISNFDYKQYCNGNPVCCYYYRKAESQKAKAK